MSTIPIKKSNRVVVILQIAPLNYSLVCNETKNIKKIMPHMLLLFGVKAIDPVRSNFVSPGGPLKGQERSYTLLLFEILCILLHIEMPKKG